MRGRSEGLHYAVAWQAGLKGPHYFRWWCRQFGPLAGRYHADLSRLLLLFAGCRPEFSVCRCLAEVVQTFRSACPTRSTTRATYTHSIRIQPFAERLREPGADGVLQDVPRDIQSGFIVSQYPLMVSGLPERPARRLPRCEAGDLLEMLHKARKVGILRLGDRQQVDVIRHEDVRDNREPERRRGLQNLGRDVGSNRIVLEDRLPEGSARCDKIALETDIAHAIQATRTIGDHTKGGANGRPEGFTCAHNAGRLASLAAGLKACTTPTSGLMPTLRPGETRVVQTFRSAGAGPARGRVSRP